jgi:hypothetical protein
MVHPASRVRRRAAERGRRDQPRDVSSEQLRGPFAGDRLNIFQCSPDPPRRARGQARIMSRIGLVIALLILAPPSLTVAAGPKDDVAAAAQAWINAMNSRDPERVVSLYDSEAVLWGTRSPTLRDNPATVREYFNILRTVPTSYKAVLGEQRIRIYGDINSGTYTFSETREGEEIIRRLRYQQRFLSGQM